MVNAISAENLGDEGIHREKGGFFSPTPPVRRGGYSKQLVRGADKLEAIHSISPLMSSICLPTSAASSVPLSVR